MKNIEFRYHNKDAQISSFLLFYLEMNGFVVYKKNLDIDTYVIKTLVSNLPSYNIPEIDSYDIQLHLLSNETDFYMFKDTYNNRSIGIAINDWQENFKEECKNFQIIDYRNFQELGFEFLNEILSTIQKKDIISREAYNSLSTTALVYCNKNIHQLLLRTKCLPFDKDNIPPDSEKNIEIFNKAIDSLQETLKTT